MRNIKDSVELKDIKFKYLTETEKELKETLRLYKKVEGSHKSKHIRPKISRVSNPQTEELNECINEAIRNLDSGVEDESAWKRLSLKIEGWGDVPEYSNIVKKANNAINKFTKYLDNKKNLEIKDSDAGTIWQKGDYRIEKYSKKVGYLLERYIGFYKNKQLFEAVDPIFAKELINKIMKNSEKYLTKDSLNPNERKIYARAILKSNSETELLDVLYELIDFDGSLFDKAMKIYDDAGSVPYKAKKISDLLLNAPIKNSNGLKDSVMKDSNDLIVILGDNCNNSYEKRISVQVLPEDYQILEEDTQSDEYWESYDTLCDIINDRYYRELPDDWFIKSIRF